MRYYVIINGVNSLSIKGLAIKTLPSIIKPMMRTLREEIDGRNGDVITNLGYSAYDKQLEIGLYGEYDIDSIMAYFNQEGTIIFSDEADKIYNFKILDQIDYAKLLKFKTAVVNLHIQPFKYPLEEEPIELIDSYVEGEGESLTLNETESAPLEIDLKGNTSQVHIEGETGLEVEGTSISVNDVNTTKEHDITLKGNTSQVQYSGKNLCPLNAFTLLRSSPRTIQINFPTPLPAGTYTISFKITNKSGLTSSLGMGIGIFNGSTSLGSLGSITNDSPNTYTYTKTTEQQATHLYFYLISDLPNDATITIDELQFELSASQTSYEPYCGGTPSPNPSYPQDIHSVSGDNEIVVCGKNILNPEVEIGSINSTTGANETNNNNIRTIGYIDISSADTWYFKRITSTNNIKCRYYDENFNYLGYQPQIGSNLSMTMTRPTNAKYIRFTIDSITSLSYFTDYQVMLSNENIPYEPYIGNTYHITLPNGITLNKIGNYQDKLYYVPSLDKVYKHKEIGEVVLDGSETWGIFNSSSSRVALRTIISDIEGYTNGNDTPRLYVSHFTPMSYNGTWKPGNASRLTNVDSQQTLTLITEPNTTKEQFQTWLSTHNTSVYYVLSTPIEEEITDSTLKAQVKALYEATIYGTTNINSIPNDLEPFIDFKYNYITQSPSPDKPSTINVVSGTNTITITNQDSSQTQTYQIRLGSIKLRKTGTEEDYIYKSGDKWYLHTEIGTKTFVGNVAEGWGALTIPTGLKVFTTNLSDIKQYSDVIYSDLFSQVDYDDDMSRYESYTPCIATTYITIFIMLGDGSITASSDFRKWLGVHNTTIIYPLETPVDTEITDTDLLDDLEALYSAVSYANQTNISQTNNDKPFILYAKALKQGSGESIVENTGNIYAKPTFEIEGTGLVQVLIDNNQVLEVDTTNDTIVIDTENMEATNKTDGTLANRQVVGDYSKIKLNVGNNDVKLTGNYTKGTITKYTRYL